jgi:hypothetical protein
MAHHRNAPDPSLLSGNYDTTETAGPNAPHTELRGVTSAFDRARAGDLAWALRGMDPSDEEVSSNIVQTSPGLTVNRGDPDGDRQRVAAAAQRAADRLAEAGLEVDATTGEVRTRDHSTPWMNHAASLGPMVTVEENTDRSAG